MPSSDSESDESSGSDDYYGPALPPNFSRKSETEGISTGAVTSSGIPSQEEVEKKRPSQIGPILPASMKHLVEKAAEISSSIEQRGLHPGYQFEENKSSDSDSDSESEIIGPLPPDHPKANQVQHTRLSLRNPIQSDIDSKKLQREEWMLIPPKNRPLASLGLASRKFLARTPADSKPDDEDDEEEDFDEMARVAIEQKVTEEYDAKMDQLKNTTASNKRGATSLLELHQQELKKKKESTEVAERRPFDRDNDLKVGSLSSDDRMKYIQKSRELDTRFMKGKKKYL